MGNTLFGQSREFQRGLALLSDQHKRMQSKKHQLNDLIGKIPHELDNKMLVAVTNESIRFEFDFQKLQTLRDCANLAHLGRNVIHCLNGLIEDILATMEKGVEAVDDAASNAQGTSRKKTAGKKAAAKEKPIKSIIKAHKPRNVKTKKTVRFAITKKIVRFAI